MTNNKEEQDGPMVSEVDGDLVEDNTYELQDKVLTCLRELELLTTMTKRNVEMMEEGIKSLRTYIHGEETS